MDLTKRILCGGCGSTIEVLGDWEVQFQERSCKVTCPVCRKVHEVMWPADPSEEWVSFIVRVVTSEPVM